MKTSIPTDTWRVLQALHPNVLVIDPDIHQRKHTIDAIVEGSHPPVWRCDCRPLSLPAEDVGTLVVPDVDALTSDEQQLLLDWAERNRKTQLVTASAVPLYPAVEAGTFLDGLYYRLNVLLITEADS